LETEYSNFSVMFPRGTQPTHIGETCRPVSTKYKQINSEGCKLVGEGGAHETDPHSPLAPE